MIHVDEGHWMHMKQLHPVIKAGMYLTVTDGFFWGNRSRSLIMTAISDGLIVDSNAMLF